MKVLGNLSLPTFNTRSACDILMFQLMTTSISRCFPNCLITFKTSCITSIENQHDWIEQIIFWGIKQILVKAIFKHRVKLLLPWKRIKEGGAPVALGGEKAGWSSCCPGRGDSRVKLLLAWKGRKQSEAPVFLEGENMVNLLLSWKGRKQGKASLVPGREAHVSRMTIIVINWLFKKTSNNWVSSWLFQYINGL